MTFLQLTQVDKIYPDGTRAVHPLSLDIEEGEFIVLLGPSGCGKTTTLRMVAGLELPSSGRIALAGQEVTRLRPSQRDVGFVFQFYALYPHLTVHENIAFPLAAIGMARRERTAAVVGVAERLGLSTLLGQHPRQLSGGDQQRVALARAMIRKPRLWLMDEPLGTLDADQRAVMREFIREQQLASNITTLYVTHDQEEAMSLADRVVVMQAGRICQAGPPSAVYDDPAARFVAEFIGSPGMNFIDGRVIDGDFFQPAGDAGSPWRLPRPIRSGPAVLGIRPEYIHAAADGLTGTVVMDEYLGHCRILHLEAGFCHLRMRQGPHVPASRGSTLAVHLDLGKACWFDADTGRRL